MLSRFVAGLLVVCALFAPLSFSVEKNTSALPITVHIQKADAAFPLLIPGAIALAGALGIGSWVSNTVADYVNSFFAFIGSLFVRLAVSILGLTGAVFDYAVWAFASNLTETLQAMGIVDAIRRIWVVFRDLSQIVLVGFFIFIAINIILNNHEYSIKQHAVRAILVALFMNFSLFFSMAVIDVSNFIAYQFYRGIANVGGSVTQTNLIGTQANISERIVTSLGLTQLNNWSSWTGQDLKKGGILETIVASIGITFILLITSLVLLYAVWLLLRRAVLLILIMLTSSLATTALIIPKFQSYFDQWRSALLGNAFFAPLFLIMLWTVIQIMDAIAGSNLPGLRPETFVQPNAIQGAGSALARYGVVIGLLIAAVKISDILAKKGSELFGMSIGGVGGGMGMISGMTAAPFGATQSFSRTRAATRLKAQRDEIETKLGSEKDIKRRQDLIDQREKIQKRIESGGGAFSAKIDKILGSMQKLATGKDAKGPSVKDIIKKKDDKEKADTKKIVEAAQPHVDADRAYDQHIAQQQKIVEKGAPPTEEDTKTLKVQLGAVEATRKELAEKVAAQPEPKNDFEKQEQAKNVKAIQANDEQIKQLRAQISKQAEEREAFQTAQNDLAQFSSSDEKTRVEARNKFIEQQMQAANNPSSSAASQQRARLEQTIRTTLGVDNQRVLSMATTELLKDKATKEREKLYGLLERAGEKAEAPKIEAPQAAAPAPAAAKSDGNAAH